MSDETELPDVCCPDADRIDDLQTRGGQHVFDAHRHKGLIKGSYFETSGKKRTLFWHRNGRLSRTAEHPMHDLRRVR